MATLIWLALLLFAIWLVAVVFFRVLGCALHLLVVAAAVLAVVWVVMTFL
jgi:hypothetical protein